MPEKNVLHHRGVDGLSDMSRPGALFAGSLINAVSLEFYSRDTNQRECLRLSRTVNVAPSAVPAMPVAIAEVIEVLDTPFSGGAAPFDICVVVQALVV